MPIINQWDKGILNNTRMPIRGGSANLINWDTTNPYTIKPHLSTESGDDAPTTRKIKNFTIGRHGGLYNVYGLGATTLGYAKIYFKSLTTSSKDLSDDDWDGSLNDSESSAGAVNYDLFIWYERDSRLYGARDNRYIWEYSPNGSFVDVSLDLSSFDHIAQGLVHSKDDILYIPYDNKIAKNTVGEPWNSNAIAIPEEFYISSICEYGNYLAIAATPVSGSAGTSGLGVSKVYLWDRDATLTTLSESIDFGEGKLNVIEELEGYLIGISESNVLIRNKIIFRAWNGGSSAKKFAEMESDDLNEASILEDSKQKVNNKVFFGMGITFERNETPSVGVWSVEKISGAFSIKLEHTCGNNDTVYNNGAVTNFIDIGGYMLISYLDSDGDEKISKTIEDGYYYDQTAIWQSMINPEMSTGDRGHNKQLKGVRLVYKPLFSFEDDSEIKLYYRADGGSWTEIFTDDIKDPSIQIIEKAKDVNGSNFSEAREYDFKVESKGVALIELFYTYDIIKTQL